MQNSIKQIIKSLTSKKGARGETLGGAQRIVRIQWWVHRRSENRHRTEPGCRLGKMLAEEHEEEARAMLEEAAQQFIDEEE